MSLINEALKRAQHQRKVEEAGYSPPVPGGSSHHITHRGKPMASHTLVLIVAGSVAIVVLTVVATVYLLRDDSTPAVDRAPAPAIVKSTEVAPTDTASTPAVVLSIPAPAVTPIKETVPAPVVAAPITPPVKEAPSAPVTKPAATPVAVAPQPAAPAAKPAPVTPDVVAQAPAANPPAAVVPSAPPDQQVLIFLDNLRIMGVRFAGIDSKVLISDRVYRVNDIIERNFGLRLVEVQPDRLFFVDAKGVAYTKNL